MLADAGIERVVLGRLRARRAETLTRDASAAGRRRRPGVARRRARSATPRSTRRQPFIADTALRDPELLARAIALPDAGGSTPAAAPRRHHARCGRSCAGIRCSRRRSSRGTASAPGSRCASSSSAPASPRISTRWRSRSSRPPPTPPRTPRLGYRETPASATSLRPKTSQSEAELHGAFDEAIGSTDPADHAKLLAVALREAGTLFDVDVPRLDDPSQRDPAAGDRASSPTRPCRRRPEDAAAADGRGAGAGPVRRPRHGRARPSLPARRPRPRDLARLPGGRPRPDHRLPVRNRGLHRPLPRGLARAPAVPARARRSGRALGRARRSTCCASPSPPATSSASASRRRSIAADLDLFGPWRSLPRGHPLERRRRRGRGGRLAVGAHPVRGGHARPRRAAPARGAASDGDGRACARRGLDRRRTSSAPSTSTGRAPSMITAEARWIDPIDDLEPPRARRAGDAGDRVHLPDPRERGPRRPLGGVPTSVTVPGVGPVWFHSAIQRLGDTRHHTIHYRFRASTRFREYFDPETLAPPDPDAPPAPGSRSTTARASSGRRSRSRCRARRGPAAPVVHSVLPLFRWDAGTEPEQPVATRRRRRAGVRIYLERPWYSSGEGELLGVLLAPGGERHAADAASREPVGRRPRLGERARRAGARCSSSSTTCFARSGSTTAPATRSRCPPAHASADGGPGEPAGHRARLPPAVQRRRAGCGTSTWRSTPGARSGRSCAWRSPATSRTASPAATCRRPVRCDFVQLTPERTTSVSRTDVRHVRVVVSGPIGVREPPPGRGTTTGPSRPTSTTYAAWVRMHRTVVARLQRLDPAIPTDLGWETVATAELTVRGFGRNVFEAAWVGELEAPEDLPLRTPGENADWRVTVEEWERLRATRGPRRSRRAARLGAAADLRRRDPALVTAATARTHEGHVRLGFLTRTGAR